MRKGFGIIKLISTIIAGHVDNNSGKTIQELSSQKSFLLTNGFAAPMPRRIPNQRQRRKLARQMQKH